MECFLCTLECVYTERREGCAFPLCLPFSSAHKFLPIQQCSTGSRKPKIPLLVERGRRDGEDPPPFARNSFSTVDGWNSSVFRGGTIILPCRPAYGIASLDRSRRASEKKKEMVPVGAVKIEVCVPFHFQSDLLPNQCQTAMAIWPLKCNIVKVNQ